jgi:hypothetical protein
MRTLATLLAVPALAFALPALATEVEVTRFHTPDSLAQATPGPVMVRAVEGLDEGSLESRVWLDAVSRQLERQGFTVVPDAPRVVEVSLVQDLAVRGSRGGPSTRASVGIGVGSGGGHYYRRGGTSVGLGLGLSFGGRRSGEVLDSRLAVTLADAATGAHLWEGRAEAAPRERSKDADPNRLAEEMASALFAGFPGESGATIGYR